MKQLVVPWLEHVLYLELESTKFYQEPPIDFKRFSPLSKYDKIGDNWCVLRTPLYQKTRDAAKDIESF